jgi:hypothetical protein
MANPEKFRTLKSVIIGTRSVPAGKVIDLDPEKDSTRKLLATGHVEARPKGPFQQQQQQQPPPPPAPPAEPIAPAKSPAPAKEAKPEEKK